MIRYFIKVGARDKLFNLANGGGGFQTVEVMVTNNFELTVPEPERQYWVELYPSWEEKTIHVNSFEGGVLMGMIEGAEERLKPSLSGIRGQLIAMRKDIEKAAGVVKKLLPNGMLEITDEDGNRIIRPPYSWEIEGN